MKASWLNLQAPETDQKLPQRLFAPNLEYRHDGNLLKYNTCYRSHS